MIMNKQQTVVEWLEDTLIGNPFSEKDFAHNVSVFKQAKAMEKEQITRAYFKGHCDGYNAGVSVYEQVEFQSAEQYYSETYGS